MKLKDMKIYIVTSNYDDYAAFKYSFKMHNNVTVINDDFVSFMGEEGKNIDVIVSPANCYGEMDGGYDAAISDYLGWDFQKNVQKYIKDNFYGEQIVGTSFIIDAPKGKKLIHTPTMIVPSVIKDEKIIYTSMRSTLICSLKNNIKSIVLPVFGTGTGGVSSSVSAKLSLKAYNQILNAQNGEYRYYN